MRTALYIGKGKLFNRLIRAVQRARGMACWKVSHTEVVLQDLGDGFYLCGSSSVMDGGVRMKVIRLNTPNWLIVGEVGREHAAIVELKKVNGEKYDFIGALSKLLPFLRGSKKREFCSEICSRLLGIGGSPFPAELAKRLTE